jgi:hypothetical protein
VQGKSVAISFHFAVGKSDPAAINIYTHRRQVAADFTHHTTKGDRMRLIAFPQWDKIISLLRGMARQSAAEYAKRKIVCTMSAEA